MDENKLSFMSVISSRKQQQQWSQVRLYKYPNDFSEKQLKANKAVLPIRRPDELFCSYERQMISFISFFNQVPKDNWAFDQSVCLPFRALRHFEADFS